MKKPIRPISLLLVLLAASSLTAAGAEPAAASVTAAPAHKMNATPLPSTIFDWNDLAAMKTPVGERRDVAERPTATLQTFECHISTLNPGQKSHPPHQHPQEELIILKEGSLDVSINGVTTRVGPGSLFFFASNDFHNVANNGDTPATYLVFNFATAATRTAPKVEAAKSAPATALRSAVYDWSKLPVTATATGGRRSVFDSPTVTCLNLESHVTTLDPGKAPHASHHHPDEELVIVKSGELEVTVAGTTRRVGPGSVSFFSSNDEHSLRNSGATDVTYYILRCVTAATPKPI